MSDCLLERLEKWRDGKMLPRGYDPKNYGGKIWWNENNPEMRKYWGTQKDYDKHVQNGGTWAEYAQKAAKQELARRNK